MPFENSANKLYTKTDYQTTDIKTQAIARTSLQTLTVASKFAGVPYYGLNRLLKELKDENIINYVTSNPLEFGGIVLTSMAIYKGIDILDNFFKKDSLQNKILSGKDTEIKGQYFTDHLFREEHESYRTKALLLNANYSTQNYINDTLFNVKHFCNNISGKSTDFKFDTVDAFDKNNINFTHMMAMMAKVSPEYLHALTIGDNSKEKLLTNFINDSDKLTKMLSHNVGSLQTFIKKLKGSMKDEILLIENGGDFKSAQKTFDDLVDKAMGKAVLNYQKYNIHKDFSFLVAGLHDKILNENLSSGDLEEAQKKLVRFKETLTQTDSKYTNKFENLLNTIDGFTAELGVFLTSKYALLTNDDISLKLNNFITNYSKNGKPLSLNQGLDVKVRRDDVFDMLFKDSIEKPLNLKSEIVKELLKAIENKIENTVSNSNEVKPSVVSSLSPKEISDLKNQYLINQSSELTSENIASSSMVRVKQRMLQEAMKENDGSIKEKITPFHAFKKPNMKDFERKIRELNLSEDDVDMSPR